MGRSVAGVGCSAPWVPGKLLLLFFTALPVIELYLLIQLGKLVGAGPTIALVLATGVLGVWLARREGTRVLRSWQASMARGEVPKEGAMASVLVLLGGVLLVIPGVVTDVLGLVLLLPWTRRWVAASIRRRLEQRFAMQQAMMGGQSLLDPSSFGAGAPSEAPGPRGVVIDVEAVEHEPSPTDRDAKA
jgi:UPF0716 protein FxsA